MVGLTTGDATVMLPGIQKYVSAPLAVKLLALPEQIEGELADSVKEGVEFTFTITVSVAIQPKASVTETLYVWLDPGVAITTDEVVELKLAPGVQLYV